MGFSTETNNIILALRDLAEEYAFTVSTEHSIFPHRERSSERVDVVFHLPSGRPVLWFEIDNHRDRAAHNRLKVFGDVLALSALPVVAVAVHHGRVAVSPHAYPSELLNSGFVLPPRFLDTVSVNNSSFETIAADLRHWLQQLVSDLATAPKWGTVFDIAEQYQPLIRNLSLQVAAAHLEVHSELAWFLVENGRVSAERAACLSVALARMLQRAGFHSDALPHIKRLRNRLPDFAALSATTNDDATTIEFLLNQPPFESGTSLDHLSFAFERVQADYNKSKFLWRQAIGHIVNTNFREAEYVIESYLSLMHGSRIAESNIALLHALASILLRRGDPREYSEKYSRHERYLLAQTEGTPDGTVHGVATSLYLKLVSETACGNKHAIELFSEVDAFCSAVRLPRTADGLREIRVVLPQSTPSTKPIDTETLSSLLNRGRKDALDKLCTTVDDVCS